MREKKIYFTGGGTGGHIFPGIAIIDTLKEKYGFLDSDFIWIGSGIELEKKILKRFNIKYMSICSGKLRRYFSIYNFIDPFKILFGFFQIFFHFIFNRPKLVFSKGGYVSVAPVIASKILKIPVFTHESDIVPGLATKINIRFVDNCFLPYEESVKYLSKFKEKLIVSGNPVRKEILLGDKKNIKNIKTDKKIIFVYGGSQGSEFINNIITENLNILKEKFFIIHQTGKFSNFDDNNYYAKDFFYEDFPHILDFADLVICRAGAGSLWENGVKRKPAILIPLGKSGSRGDQIVNAEFFKNQGAAEILYEETITSKILIDKIEEILYNETCYLSMQKSLEKICIVNACDNIAKRLVRFF